MSDLIEERNNFIVSFEEKTDKIKRNPCR